MTFDHASYSRAFRRAIVTPRFRVELDAYVQSVCRAPARSAFPHNHAGTIDDRIAYGKNY